MHNDLVIFDFDGVIVNTEYTTFSFYKQLLSSYGIHLRKEDFHLKAGRKSIDFFKDILGDTFDEKIIADVIGKKRQAFLRDVKRYLKPQKGAFDLLLSCKEKGLCIALGSQNERDLIDKALQVFQIEEYFAMTTSLQDIKKKKPDPEVFLLITHTLGYSPKQAVVIEDSPLGIEAARAGGFKSVGLTTSFSKKDLALADLVIDSLTELSPALLKEI